MPNQCLSIRDMKEAVTLLELEFYLSISFISNSLGTKVNIDNGTNKVFMVMLVDHFITINVFHSNGEQYQIMIYDSISRTRDKAGQLCNIIFERIVPIASDVTFSWQNMQIQVGKTACGLFTVASALALCNRLDPSDIHWSQDAMLGHFRKCIKTNVMFNFPHSECPDSVLMSGSDVVRLRKCEQCKGVFSHFRSGVVTAAEFRLTVDPDLLRLFNLTDICKCT